MKKVVLIFCAYLLIISKVRGQSKDDWSLEKCIDYAYTQNISIRKNELAITRSEKSAEQIRAQRFPSAGASVNHSFSWTKNTSGGSGFMGYNGTNYSLNSDIVLFGASKITNLIKQADLNVQSGTLTLETTKESVSLSILDAFLQVLYAEEQVKNSERQLESTNEQVKLANERLNLKGISRADYAQLVSQRAKEKLTLANSKNQLSLVKINLMQLMELPVSDSFNIVHPVLPETPNQNRVPDVRKIYETALSIKPQIRNASINKDIIELDEKVAKAGYFPALSANAGLSNSYSDNFSGSYFGKATDGLHVSAGLSLSIPIYQKKQVKTSIAIAKIGYSDAELDEINTHNELRKNIEQACQDLVAAQVEYEASVESYKANVESAMQSDEKFRQGMINSVDYLVAKTSLIAAESQLLQSKYNLIFVYKTLDFYSGIPIVL